MKAHILGVPFGFTLVLSGCAASPPPNPRVPSAPNSASIAPSAASADAGTSAPPAPPAPAHVRTIHACPEAAYAHIGAFADGIPVPFLPNLGYRQSSAYLDVPPGPHAIDVRVAGSPPNGQPLGRGNVPGLESGSYHTVIAHGVTGTAPGFTLTTHNDDATPPEPGTARFRFFHAIAGIPAIDSCLVGAVVIIPIATPPIPTFSNVQYGAWGQAAGELYYTSPAGLPTTVQFRRAAGRPCSGQVIGSTNITLQPGTVVTTVAIGNVGRTRVAPELLVCTDIPRASSAQCTVLPIR